MWWRRNKKFKKASGTEMNPLLHIVKASERGGSWPGMIRKKFTNPPSHARSFTADKVNAMQQRRDSKTARRVPFRWPLCKPPSIHGNYVTHTYIHTYILPDCVKTQVVPQVRVNVFQEASLVWAAIAVSVTGLHQTQTGPHIVASRIYSTAWFAQIQSCKFTRIDRLKQLFVFI
jgi:hypothetical protein